VTTATETSGYVLSQDILDRCYQRAPIYDQENRFFHEDFEELQAAGYLTMAVPQELGGRA
jgi:alkylation response protein AidB-like acyl-CoA dehydrogenase